MKCWITSKTAPVILFPSFRIYFGISYPEKVYLFYFCGFESLNHHNFFFTHCNFLFNFHNFVFNHSVFRNRLSYLVYYKKNAHFAEKSVLCALINFLIFLLYFLRITNDFAATFAGRTAASVGLPVDTSTYFV